MRNFRTAAVAASTAVAVAFGGAAAASAEEATVKEENLSSNLSSAFDKYKELDGEFETLSSKWGAATEADHEVIGGNLLGERTHDERNALWSKIWRDGTYALLGTAAAGAVIAAYNYAVYTGIVPQHILDPIFR